MRPNISVQKAVFNRIKRLAKASHPNETYGIFLGRIHGNNYTITDTYVPEDVAAFCDRTSVDVQYDWWEAARNLASESGLEVLGDWHTHPEDACIPSAADWHGSSKVMSMHHVHAVLSVYKKNRQRFLFELSFWPVVSPPEWKVI